MKALVAAALLAGLVSPALADTPKEQKARADRLFDDGRKYLQNKEYALACAAFEQSEAADPALGTELNIALCYEQWGHVAAAYHAYQEAERIAQERKDSRIKTAQKKIAELAPKVPAVGFDLPPGADTAAIFLLDGKEIDRGGFAGEIEVEPGPHAIEARVPGQDPKTTHFDIEVGEHKRVTVDLPQIVVKQTQPPPPKVIAPPAKERIPGKFWGGIGLVSGGGIAIAAASTVALLARSDYAKQIASCPGDVCETHAAYTATNDDRSRANAMTYVAAGGVVLAGVGVYLLLTDQRDRPTPVTAMPLVTPNTLGVTFGGGW